MKKFFQTAGRAAGTVVLLLFALCTPSCIEEEIKCVLPEELKLVTESIVDTGEMHLAFPTITGTADGSKLLVAYREGKTHISFDGCIVQKESYDKGRTWINRQVIYRPENPTGDARDPQYLTLPDGRVICRFFERASEKESGVKMIISSDWGKTWRHHADLPAHSPNETYAAARGNMLLEGQTIYTSMYNRWHDSWLMRSDDLGETWRFASWLNRSDASLYGMHRQLNESSLCLQDGLMFMVGRSGYDVPHPMPLAVSTDRGNTWEQWADLGVSGHSPSLTPYGNQYILTYRNINTAVNADGNVHFDCVLFDRGKLVSKPYTIIKSKSTDIGYGDVFTFDDFFLVCCYAYNTIHCFSISYAVFEPL